MSLVQEGIRLEGELNQFNKIIDSQLKNIQLFIKNNKPLKSSIGARPYMEASSMTKIMEQQFAD